MPDTNGFVMNDGDLIALVRAVETTKPMTPDSMVRRRELAEVGLKMVDEVIGRCIGDEASRAGGYIQEFLGDDMKMRAAAVAYSETATRRQLLAIIDALNSRAAFRPHAKNLKAALNERAVDVAASATKNLDLLAGDALGAWGLQAPFGFSVTEQGVFMDVPPGKDGEIRAPVRLLPSPLLIVGTSRDLEAGTIRLELAWKRLGRWHRTHVDRDQALDRSKVVRLAKAGAPVTSEIAKDVVHYLSRFEDVNIGALEEAGTSTHMGWTSEGFLIGEEAIQPTDAPSCKLKLAIGDGPARLAQGFKESGTWGAWRDAIEPIAKRFPLAALAIIAACAAPVVDVLGVDGFVVDFSGETSRGKTNALRLGASVFGDPDQLIHSWSTSSTFGPMMLAWLHQSLPVFLDDTKQARREHVAELMYALPSGHGRLQGTKDGSVRDTKQWRTVTLSTGEAPITSFSRDAGARARCLIAKGPPFGDPDPATSELLQKLRDDLRKHHGLLGRYLIAKLVRGDREAFRERFLTIRADLVRHGNGAVEDRLLSNVAVLRFTQRLIEEIGFPRLSYDPMQPIIDAAGLSLTEEDPATEAVRLAYTWAAMNATRFWGRHRVDRRNMDEPATDREFWGRWDRKDWLSIGFDPERLFAHLATFGHDPHAIWATWQSRDWVESNNGRFLRRRINGVLVQLIAVKLTVFADVIGDEILED